jgi:signal transduction histidine kinase
MNVKVTPVFVIVTILLLLLTWLLESGLNLNSARYDTELAAFHDFARLERGLNREALTARVGLSRNYDALVHMSDGLTYALDRLREAAGADSKESGAIEVLAADAAREQELIEHFKTRNALLQNSFAYFAVLNSRLATSDDAAVAAISTRLSAAMLRLTLDTSPAAADEVQGRLNELAALKSPPGEANFIQATIAHAGVLHDLLPSTDTVLKELLTLASDPEQDVARSLIVKRQLAARVVARRYRLFLYVTSLTLLGVLVYFLLQLRARGLALRRRAAFEHVIARISTRFINSQHHEIAVHVECALGELAECVGADRAYFVVAGEPVLSYRWLRRRAEFPPGWPERALSIVSHFDRGDDGIIHLTKVRPLDSSDAANLLADAGLQGWLCIANKYGNKTEAILGFDALRANVLTQYSEVTLFRMAFDAIANAVSRVTLEQEKERLQASLQQAHRMETIGTFASGIAHNFNNIVGAILGYTEMADVSVGSEGQPAASLAGIRSAGERARELVGQILDFGRRGEGRRERICVKALLAETTRLLAASLPSHVGITVEATPERLAVSADSAQLQQVILNICNNAAQAMDRPGVIEIQIGARELTEALRVGNIWIGPGRFATVSITDPGAGMDAATLERIFEPFFTTRPDGNGLGLATVREFVQEHDGAVEVRSAVGVGTRFDIWLPRASANEPISVQHAPGIAARGSGETVLVLEADHSRLLRHEEILAALGYEPVGFPTLCETALRRAAQARFDVALICHQPGAASALDLAAVLHDLAPALPIILVTPSARSLDAPLLAASGISEVVHHPLGSAELAGALSRCLAASVAPQLVS